MFQQRKGRVRAGQGKSAPSRNGGKSGSSGLKRGRPSSGPKRSGSDTSGTKRSGSGYGQRRSKSRFSSATPRRDHKSRFNHSPQEMVSLSSIVNPLGQRLQIALAMAGYGSRRQCEELISTGRVQVDGEIVNQLGARVLPQQKIMVDGEQLSKVKSVYLVVYKPKGVLCTNSDPTGRPRAIDLIPPSYGRLFSVGRLDLNSEGLLLLTNDGILAQRLTHPRYEVSKKYKVQVAGFADYEIVDQLKKGVYLAEAIVQADEVIFKARYKNSSILEIVLREGKNREIRRMLARMGHKVLRLQRTAIGPVKLGKMTPGEYRVLTRQEVDKLYQAAGIKK